MPNKTNSIYLDYAAAAPLWPVVIEAVSQTLYMPGNPGSMHEQGYALKQLWHDSLRSIAKQLGCTADELIITSGATESANLAILGSLLHQPKVQPVHCISSTAEHAACYGPLKELEQEGASITWLPVNIHGQIEVQSLADAIGPATKLVSLIAAHNETGAIQPIRAIVAAIRAAEQRVGHRILIHLDCAQLAAWQPLNAHALGADLITISGNKLGGPHCGLLYVRRGIKLHPIMHGGGQQQGRRPGTEDVSGVAGLALALKTTWGLLPIRKPVINALHDRLGSALNKAFPTLVRRDVADGLPNMLHLTLPGLDGEQAVYALSQAGIAVATGSACTATNRTSEQRVRAALGINATDQPATLRISLGMQTTDEEITRAIPIFIDILNRTLAQTNLTKRLQASGRDLSQAYAKGQDE